MEVTTSGRENENFKNARRRNHHRRRGVRSDRGTAKHRYTDHLMAEKPYNKRMLRILVDNESNGDKVTVQFPVGAVKKILKVTGKLPLPEEQMQDFDLAELMEAINECLDEELDGDIVNVTSSAENTTIRICIE